MAFFGEARQNPLLHLAELKEDTPIRCPQPLELGVGYQAHPHLAKRLCHLAKALRNFCAWGFRDNFHANTLDGTAEIHLVSFLKGSL